MPWPPLSRRAIPTAAHPSISGLYLYGDRQPHAVDADAVEIAVTYSKLILPSQDPNYVHIRGRVTLVTEKSNCDHAGAEVYTEHKESSDRPAKKQLGTIDKSIPSLTLQYSWRQTANPINTAAAVVGRTNSDTFRGDTAGYWLVSSIDFDSPDGAIHWDLNLEVTFHERQWKQLIYYVLSDGRIPSNWNESYNQGKTVKLIQVCGQIPFSQFNLPLV